MRKFIIIFLPIICIITGCTTYKVEVVDFTGKDLRIVRLKISHKAVAGELDNNEAVYVRTIKDKTKNPVKIIFQFYAEPYSRILDKKGYILTDNTIYTVKVENRKSIIKREMVGGVTVNPLSPTMSDYKEIWKNLTGTISINEKIEKSLRDANKLEYIFTAGGLRTTLLVSDEELQKIKEFLDIDFNNISEQKVSK